MSHLYLFNFSWTIETCIFNFPIFDNCFPHISHFTLSKFLSFSWNAMRCLFNTPLWAKLLPQIPQLWFLTYTFVIFDILVNTINMSFQSLWPWKIFPTCITFERFFAMDICFVSWKVVCIKKQLITLITFVTSDSSVLCFDMVSKLSSNDKTFVTCFTLVSFQNCFRFDCMFHVSVCQSFS